MNSFLPRMEENNEEGREDGLAYDDSGPMAMQATLDIPEPTAGGMRPELRNR